MIDFSKTIESLEKIKTELQEAQKQNIFSESSKNASDKFDSILEKSLSARNEIRSFIIESTKNKDIAEKIGEYGLTEKDSINETKKIASEFEKMIFDFESNAFEKLVCTDEIHSALNEMSASEQQELLDKIAENFPSLYKPISDLVFVFSDILNLSDNAIQKVLREIDTQTLVRALVGADEKIKEKIFRNMSKNAVTMLKEDMGYIGCIRKIDVEECRNAICGTVLRLFDSGEIVIAKGESEELIYV